MTKTEGDPRQRNLCNLCSAETWHIPLATHSAKFPIYQIEQFGPDEYGRIEVGETREEWLLIQCQGCDSISAKQYKYDTREDGVYYFLYPERTSDQLPRKTYQKLPKHLDTLYSDVIRSFNRYLYLLCAIGIRALLEGVCNDRGINKGPTQDGKERSTLEGKINGLISLVPESIVRNLHGIRIFGNQAAHELDPPTKEELELSISVMEDILNVVYDLDYKAGRLFLKSRRFKN